MEKVQFSVYEEADALPDLSCAFEVFLFNERRHLQHQKLPGDTLIFLLLTDRPATRLLASLPLILHHQTASNPRRATFGGFDAAPALPAELLSYFLEEVKAEARRRGISSIELRQPPLALRLRTDVTDALESAGFEQLYADVNYHRFIDGSAFRASIRKGEKWILSKARRKGYLFRQADMAQLPRLYDFLDAAATRKGFQLSMSLAQLQDWIQHFPCDFQAYELCDGPQTIAVGITVRLNERVIYILYLADHEAYLSDSPIVPLLEGIWNEAGRQGYELFDLGTASRRGEPIDGLCRFKKNIGFQTSENPFYVLTLEKN